MTKIIKNAANKQINFKIKIENEYYYFKFVEKDNEKIDLALDLNIDNGKLAITKNTKIMLPSINKKKPFDGTNKINKESLNYYYLMLIEKIMNSKKLDKNELKLIYKEILYKIENRIDNKINEIKENIFNVFFKNNSNLVNYSWSIIFLGYKKFNEDYLLYFLNNEKSNTEKDIFITFCDIYNKITNNLNHDNNDLDKIINLTSTLSRIVDNNTILYNLSYDKNYIINKDFKSIEETKNTKNSIQSECQRIDYFVSTFKEYSKIFQPYATLLKAQIPLLKHKINEMEIDNYKDKIIKKIEGNFKKKKLKQKILEDLNSKNTFENLREFENIIDEFIISYELEKENGKIKIFSINDEYDELISLFEKKEDVKNCELIKLLLKYSEIKEIIEHIIKDPSDKLIKLQKLNEIINEDYIDCINSFFVSEFDNNNDKIKIIKSYIYSMFVQELFEKNLEKNFQDLTNILNNLYDLEYYNKFNDVWCKFIETKYNLNSKIYIFELDYLSLLYLFIKIKDKTFDKEKGFLMDCNYFREENELVNNLFVEFEQVFNDLRNIENIETLIFKIGKIIGKKIDIFSKIENKEKLEHLETMCEEMQNYLDKKIEDNETKKIIINIFLRVKNFYINLNKKREILKFDDIEQGENRKKIFSNKYPQLINYLNHNNNIYEKLVNEPVISSFYPSKDYIPLWLICLRGLSNIYNIKVCFQINEKDIYIFESEFQEKIKEIIKKNNNIVNSNIEWLLMVSPNKIGFIENKEYEKLYLLFKYLLSEFINFNNENKLEIFEIIKKFIFDVFENVYKHGITYFLNEELNKDLNEDLNKYLNIFTFGDELSNIINKINKNKIIEFTENEKFMKLKSILERLINDKNKESFKSIKKRLEEGIKQYEKYYNRKLVEKEIESDYKFMELICKEYNNLIEKYKNTTRTKEEIDDFKEKKEIVQAYIDKKDAYYDGYFFIFNSKEGKVQWLDKSKYIDKYEKNLIKEKLEIIFGEEPNKINKKEFIDEFDNIIQKMEDILPIFVVSKKNDLELMISKLNKFKRFIELKKEMFKFNIKEKDIYDKFMSENNIDINKKLNYISNELNFILVNINILLNEYSNSLGTESDIKLLKEIKNEISIFIPSLKNIEYINNRKIKDEHLTLKENADNNIIPYFIINEGTIEGCDELKYDFGTLNLYDSEYQYMYLASLDENIKFEIKKQNNDIKLIKKNKLYLLEVKIPAKTTEEIQDFKKEGYINLYSHNSNKVVKYIISFRTETLKLNLICDEYKMKYEEKSNFSLCSSILFKNETINFTIDSPKNFRVILMSNEDNTCFQKPEKLQTKKGFSLIIKSNDNNEFLSCLIKIIICERFYFTITIKSYIKTFDYDFLISYKGIDGYLSQEIYCPMQKQGFFCFQLRIEVSQERKFYFHLKKIIENNKYIKIINEDPLEGQFTKFKDIYIDVKLIEKIKTNIKFVANVNGKEKSIIVYFDEQNNCKKKNFGFKNIENNKRIDIIGNSSYYRYFFNELNAHGNKNENYKEKNNKMKCEFINKSENITFQKLDYNSIKDIIPKKINLQEIQNFYKKISEEARIFPIYLDYLDKKIDNVQEYDKSLYDKILEDYFIMQNIYQKVKKDDEKKIYYYNYISEEINEFVNSYLYLRSITEFKSKKEIKKLRENRLKSNKKNKIIKEQKKEEKYFTNTEKQEKSHKNKEEIIKNQKINDESKKLEDKIEEKSNINLKTKELNKNEKIEDKKKEIKNKENIIKDENKLQTDKNEKKTDIDKKENNENINKYIYDKKKEKETETENKFDYIHKKNKEKNNKSNESLNSIKDTWNQMDNKIDSNLKKEKNEIFNKKENNKREKKIHIENQIKTKNYNKKYIIKSQYDNKKDKEDVWLQNKNKVYYNENNEEEINIHKYLIKDERQKKKIPQLKTNTYEQLKKFILKNDLDTEKNIEEENIDLTKITFISFKNSYSFTKIKNNQKKGKPYNPRSNNDAKDTHHELNSSFEPNNLKIKEDNKKSIPEFLKINEKEEKIKVEKEMDFLQKNFDNDEKTNILDISLNERNIFDENDKQFINLLFDKIKSKIKEDGTIEEDNSFKINEIEKPYELPLNYKNNNMDKNYIMNELIGCSQIYMEKFLEEISRSKVNFSEIGFCFIIDISLYLGTRLKLINLMVILSILKVIEIVDIKCSILLTADDKFKVLLKKYEEKINFNSLIEILYEASMIKRFRNNLAKSVQTGIKYLKSERNNTIFLIFSDSLDESILYFDYWIKNLFKDKTNSFIFFIEKKSSLNYLKNANIDTIINLWNNFETKIKEHSKEKSMSKVKIIDLNIDEKNVCINENVIFRDINEFLNEAINFKENNEGNNINQSNELNINLKKIKHFEKILKQETFKKYEEIYFINSQKKLEVDYLNDNSEGKRIKYDKKEIPEIKSFTTKLKQCYQDKTLIDSIFYPNKATQKQLSTKGTEIDIMSLILYTLHPVQEPMIYLEEKGGLIRDYSITVIIDNSLSCLSSFNEEHSFLTIINLFQILYSMAIPSLDIIFTGEKNPNIILYNMPSVNIFKDDSLFEQILKYLSNPILNTDLTQAIKAVYKLKKKKRNDKENYIFVLTDGLSHIKDEKKIFYFSKKSKSLGIKIFGIGLGIFPYKTKDLFETFIYSVNPENLLKALSKIFGKLIKTENELKLISNAPILDNETLKKKLLKIVKNNKFFYQKMREKLEGLEKGEDVLKNFCNIEKLTYDYVEFKSFNVIRGKDLEIYKKNTLITQKILMVMLWSCDLNKNGESPYVHPKYINEVSHINGGISIKTVIEHFGIENEIVVDYESALNKLLEKNNKGECNYYSVWIFCGPQYPVFPPIDGKENKSNPNLIEEFINVLILFWKNGGALVFFAEGEPLNFQVNIFLDKIIFDNKKKANFKISGDYLGDKELEQDKTGKLAHNGIFDKKNEKIKIKGIEIQRQSLSHNLGLIYEGYSIGYAVDKENEKRISITEFEKLSPFKPFSINSEGGISTLVYQADEKGRGDIIIDCGYTKCFLNMYNSGTFRFIQNIAGWTARPEIIFLTENKKPYEWRPKGIDYSVNYNALFNGFLKLEKKKKYNLDNKKTLFAIDNSSSINSLSFYINELNNIIKKYYVKNRGDIIYFWNDEKQKISKKELDLKLSKGRFGTGGTNIVRISEIIDKEKENNFKHLVIITDGEVDHQIIYSADLEMKNVNYTFDFVSVYIIGPTGNLSVGAPFCRNTPNKTFVKKYKEDCFKELMTLTLEDLNIIDNLEKYDNYKDFMDNYEKILNALKAKCIGVSENEDLESKLQLMINKIIDKNKIIDEELFNKRAQTLLGVTRGLLKDTFTLDKIRAAIHNYK